MKLLIFSPGYPPRIGGLETHAAEFNHHLAAQDEVEKIVVFTPRLPKSSPSREDASSKITIIRFPAIDIVPNYPLPLFWTREFWGMWHEIWHFNPDIVISRTRFFLTSLLALIYSKMQRRRWIHIEHGSDWVQLSSWFSTAVARIYDETIGRLIFTMSTENIAISDAVKQFILRFTKREPVIIYRGLELEHIDSVPVNNELHKKYPDKVIVMVVGRLYKWKGIANTIKAVQALTPEEQQKMVFVVIGDGEDATALKSLGGSDVVMLGALPRDEAIARLKSADIYVHSSLPGGGLSTSLLEAMYCGCAIIASPHEGAREVIDAANGILMNESSPEEIAAGLRVYLADAARRKKDGEQARDTIQSRFTWAAAAQAYLKHFTHQ